MKGQVNWWREMKEAKNENLLMFGQAKKTAKKPGNKLVKKLAKKLGHFLKLALV